MATNGKVESESGMVTVDLRFKIGSEEVNVKI